MIRTFISLASLLLLLQMPLHAQSPEAERPLTRGMGFGIMAHTYGFGLDFQYWILRGKTDLVFSTSLASTKHPKELKIESAYADQGGKRYIYDKKNYAYILAPSIGLSREIIPKSAYNRISVRSTLGVGPTLAILKPYYLEVAIPFSGSQAYVEIDKYDSRLYNYTNIVGEADFFLGLDELSVVPGFRAELGTMVDFGGGRDVIRALEATVYVDLFSKELELMDLQPNRQFFVGGAIEFFIGNLW